MRIYDAYKRSGGQETESGPRRRFHKTVILGLAVLAALAAFGFHDPFSEGRPVGLRWQTLSGAPITSVRLLGFRSGGYVDDDDGHLGRVFTGIGYIETEGQNHLVWGFGLEIFPARGISVLY